MAYAIKTLQQHFDKRRAPKRILALDGGGLRGILTLGVLARMETLLRERHGGGADFRLCHYFDLIAGTSTGAIIAATLALGWSVEQIRAKYMSLGEKVFQPSRFRLGILRAKYDEKLLIGELKKVFGAKTRLGGEELLTGLLVVTKRLDTGSPWPIGNNPAGLYFKVAQEDIIDNADYPLWQVVRASTAAPSYFESESITIARQAGARTVEGEFVDGGVSPFNNPSLQALMYATLAGYKVGWETGADKLMLVSVGTGAPDPAVKRSGVAAKHSVNALMSLMEDCGNLQEIMLQWMSSSPTARVFDPELRDLGGDLLGGSPLLGYQRYNMTLDANAVRALVPDASDKSLTSISAMDAPANMMLLHRLGVAMGERDVQADHFPAAFDLRR